MGKPEKKASKIFIYGSCVSRDTVELIIDEVEIVEYIARQSIISAFHPLAYEEFETQLKPIHSNFQQRMVRGDIEGSLPRSLKQLTPPPMLTYY